MRLKDRSAIVTGAASGIGRDFALRSLTTRNADADVSGTPPALRAVQARATMEPTVVTTSFPRNPERSEP